MSAAEPHKAFASPLAESPLRNVTARSAARERKTPRRVVKAMSAGMWPTVNHPARDMYSRKAARRLTKRRAGTASV
jgi:hypothetical protein